MLGAPQQRGDDTLNFSRIEPSDNVRLADVEMAMANLLSHKDDDMTSAALYHLRSGGGRVRADLALKSARALRLSRQITIAISAACELLHNASLVHDDLQDGDASRRGEIAVWKKFGPNTAICLGDLMVSAAYSAIASASTDHLPELIMHMHQRVSDVISGQHADLESNCVSIDQYNDVARMKSGPLLGLPVELSLIAAGLSEQVLTATAASDAIAIAYQTTDDISDAERDISSGGLNFIALVQGDMAARVNAARMHATSHARAAIKIATTLPHKSGDGFITLAEKFNPAAEMLEAI